MEQLQHKPICAKHGVEKHWYQSPSTGKGQWVCKQCARDRAKKHYVDLSPEKKQVAIDRAAAWNKAHPERNKASRDKWRAVPENWERELSRAKWLKRKHKYGLTRDQFFQLLEKQGCACAICRKPLETAKNTHVDHCHETDVVRGLLCSNCNTGLGLYKDSSLILQKAMDYLNGGNRSVIAAVLHSADEGAADGGVSDSSPDADLAIP